MDLQKVKAHLAALTATVDALEKAHLDVTNGSLNNDAPGGGFDTPAELQGRLLAELRNMKIAVQGPERYLFTLRAEVSRT